MRRLLFLTVFVCSLLTTFSQRNILLIIADDVGVGPIPGYLPNSTKANMPNLESLASNGLTFDNAWANPLCSPTRAGILTGKYGFRTNVLNATDLSGLSIDEQSLHEYIAEHSPIDYSSSLIGKWHLSGEGVTIPEYPNELGIPYFAGLLQGGVTDYYGWNLVQDSQTTYTTEYITTKITDLAIDWINGQNQPWFCWLAYNAPHTPFHLPPSVMHSQGNLSTDPDSIDANPLPYFLAMLESVDYEMGRLFANIPQTVLDSTTIIFIGDNGTDNRILEAPYPSGRGKLSLFQGGVHVPLVVSGAHVSRVNERETAIVNSTDLFATIAELTGISLSQTNDSYSFSGLLSNDGVGGRQCAYTEVQTGSMLPSGWAARDATYKFIHFETAPNRLFNLIDDPYEQNNLLGSPLTIEEQAALAKLSNVRDSLQTGIYDLPLVEQTLHIYPNPTTDKAIIYWDSMNEVPFSILDVYGRLVRNGDLRNGENVISLDGFSVGLYFLKSPSATVKFLVTNG